MCPAVPVAAAGSEDCGSDRQVADPGEHKPLAVARASEGEQRLADSGPSSVCPFPSKRDRTQTKRERAFQAGAG